MTFQVDGKLHKIFATEQKSEKFRAREFVIEITDGKFPQMVKFQLTQDKCEAIDSMNEGDDVTVHFNLRGREWNGKYFTNLDAWRIEAKSGNGPMPTEAEYPEMNQNMSNSYDDTDMPF